MKHKIYFISTMSCSPWGGSEVLWSEAALSLLIKGQSVSASVHGWQDRPEPLVRLARAGVSVEDRMFSRMRFRSKATRTLVRPILRRLSRSFLGVWLSRKQPDLVCISLGSMLEDISLISVCAARNIPYVIVLHMVAEFAWPQDEVADRIIDLFSKAKCVFFVSQGNRTLFEAQIGMKLCNAEIAWNPFNVRRDAAPPWPVTSNSVKFACIGRLNPEAKGQDLLLRVLARETWRGRDVSVSFFGKGEMLGGLRRLAQQLGLEDRVNFYGHVPDIEAVWSTHHALVLPSRYEGLPLVVVEAMHCGRPVIVTDVAGNIEVVEDGVTGYVAEAATIRHLSAAMERAWSDRGRWESVGRRAAEAIRKLVPADPATEFASKLLSLTARGANPGGESVVRAAGQQGSAAPDLVQSR